MRNRTRSAVASALAVLALAGALGWVATPASGEEAPAGPAVGAAAPAFRLNDHTGKAVAVGGGATTAWTVLAFYPKAMTPGCTREVCSLRDARADLAALDASVYAISTDDVAACAQFVKEQSLSFPLLSDPDGSVVAKYGASMEGKPFAQRYTFVVAPDGTLRHVDRSVNPASHGADLVAVLKRLRG